MSLLPHSPGTPTAQQFSPSSVPPGPGGSIPAASAPGLASAGLSHSTAGARAETLVGAEANTRPPPKSSFRGALALGAVAIVALGSAAAWLVSKRNASHPPAPERGVALAATSAAPPAPVPSQAPSAAEATQPAEPTPSAGVRGPSVSATGAIRLAVSSEPGGAVLLKNGFQVCDATPCEVLATPNETLEFQAVKGPLKGAAKVLAQRDQKVTIKLSAPSAPQPVKHESVATRMCEVEVDGLKILRACK